VLAHELGAHNIRVNSINPGMMELKAHTRPVLWEVIFKRWSKANLRSAAWETDDISPTAVFLASSDSKYMTGEKLIISGGLK
jgi:3-oxoacyl-[acyl-carrier protein] reductase